MSEHKKGNFAVFAGEQYYPLGGWNDFQEAFDTKKGAIDFCEKHKKRLHWDWWHVADLGSEGKVYDDMEDD